MTKRDYQLVADVLCDPPYIYYTLAERFADVMEKQYPNFNRVKFMLACRRNEEQGD